MLNHWLLPTLVTCELHLAIDCMFLGQQQPGQNYILLHSCSLNVSLHQSQLYVLCAAGAAGAAAVS
jgi:hypothetical protein